MLDTFKEYLNLVMCVLFFLSLEVTTCTGRVPKAYVPTYSSDRIHASHTVFIQWLVITFLCVCITDVEKLSDF